MIDWHIFCYTYITVQVAVHITMGVIPLVIIISQWIGKFIK